MEESVMRNRAFRDALNDILREEGVFRLASLDEPDVIWEYDGERWIRARLVPRQSG
jgi:hypothetical protein